MLVHKNAAILNALLYIQCTGWQVPRECHFLLGATILFVGIISICFETSEIQSTLGLKYPVPYLILMFDLSYYILTVVSLGGSVFLICDS